MEIIYNDDGRAKCVSSICIRMIVMMILNRYDKTTGKFTVPQGGAGLYFFYVHLLADSGEEVALAIRQNGDAKCYAYGGVRGSNLRSHPTGTCGAVLSLVEGISISVAIVNAMGYDSSF